jgi:hypothetical protein
MAGFTLGIIDRSPIGTWSIVAGRGAAVAGYPVSNLGTTYLGNQAWITPSGGACTLMLDLGTAPSATNDMDWLNNFFSVHFHNVDGCVVTLSRGDTNAYGSSTTVQSASLTNYAGQADMFSSFSAVAKRYWFLDIAAGVGGLGNPVKIGHVGLGYGVDIGSPLKGFNVNPRPQGTSDADGYGAPPRMDQPSLVWSGIFRGMSALTHNAVTNLTKDGSGNFVAYNTLLRAFGECYQYGLASGYTARTGLCVGSGRPMPYSRGNQLWDLSASGRPAGYGTMQIDLTPFWALNRSLMQLTISDARPRGALVVPVS